MKVTINNNTSEHFPIEYGKDIKAIHPKLLFSIIITNSASQTVSLLSEFDSTETIIKKERISHIMYPQIIFQTDKKENIDIEFN